MSRRLRSCAPTPCRKLWLRCGPLPWAAAAPPRAALWTSRGGCPAALLAAALARAVAVCWANGQAWAAAAAAGQQLPAVAQLLAQAVAAAVEEPAPAAQGTTRAAATGGLLGTATDGSRPGWPLCTPAWSEQAPAALRLPRFCAAVMITCCTLLSPAYLASLLCCAGIACKHPEPTSSPPASRLSAVPRSGLRCPPLCPRSASMLRPAGGNW